jgi:hypothetical protein
MPDPGFVVMVVCMSPIVLLGAVILRTSPAKSGPFSARIRMGAITFIFGEKEEAVSMFRSFTSSPEFGRAYY